MWKRHYAAWSAHQLTVKPHGTQANLLFSKSAIACAAHYMMCPFPFCLQLVTALVLQHMNALSEADVSTIPRHAMSLTCLRQLLFSSPSVTVCLHEPRLLRDVERGTFR